MLQTTKYLRTKEHRNVEVNVLLIRHKQKNQAQKLFAIFWGGIAK
jgi:hypothetical protein